MRIKDWASGRVYEGDLLLRVRSHLINPHTFTDLLEILSADFKLTPSQKMTLQNDIRNAIATGIGLGLIRDYIDEVTGDELLQSIPFEEKYLVPNPINMDIYCPKPRMVPAMSSDYLSRSHYF